MGIKSPSIFFAIIILFGIVLIVGTNFLLSYLAPAPEVRHENEILPPIEEIGKIVPSPEDTRRIHYQNGGFAPRLITIRATDAVGCLVTIKNDTGKRIKIGLNPHRDNADPGSDYGWIEPGTQEILDVRYPGLTQVILHNHQNPIHEITIMYGDGCQ